MAGVLSVSVEALPHICAMLPSTVRIVGSESSNDGIVKLKLEGDAIPAATLIARVQDGPLGRVTILEAAS